MTLPGLEGRGVLVTGGRSGIGAAVVGMLASEGARVAVLDVSPVPEAPATGTLHLLCDVRVEASVEEAVREAAAWLGQVHGLVQCAGITRDGVVWKLSDEAWTEVLDVNLAGAFRVLKAVVPHLREAGGGSVVNVTSINGLRGKFGQSNYAASKAGLVGLTKTAARELGAFGVRVNAVAPGMVETPMIQGLPEEFRARAKQESVLGRIATPEDVAGAVLFLLSDLARHVTGQTLSVDGGQHMG